MCPTSTSLCIDQQARHSPLMCCWCCAPEVMQRPSCGPLPPAAMVLCACWQEWGQETAAVELNLNQLVPGSRSAPPSRLCLHRRLCSASLLPTTMAPCAFWWMRLASWWSQRQQLSSQICRPMKQNWCAAAWLCAVTSWVCSPLAWCGACLLAARLCRGLALQHPYCGATLHTVVHKTCWLNTLRESCAST